MKLHSLRMRGCNQKNQLKNELHSLRMRGCNQKTQLKKYFKIKTTKHLNFYMIVFSHPERMQLIFLSWYNFS